MSDKVSLVRVLTSATGNSSPITLGARYSDLFMTPADAGAVDGRTYTWLIVDGNNWELVKGAYTASGTTMARTKVLASRISGTLGTTKLTLSGTAQVRIVEAAVDMDGVRGTRAVTGTSDILASTDLGYVVTYSNAAAVAVSLAQAGTAGLDDGFATWVQNLGVGTATITPATSTINGASTLVLATNMGAFIWSDGTNYHAYFVPVSKPLLAASNLADVTSASTARTNLGATTVGAAVFTAASAAAAQTAIYIAPTVQTFTSGTAQTYTTPAGCLWIEVFMVGGGGGGGGATSGVANTVAGSAGSTTSFNSINCSGGLGAAASLGTTQFAPGGAGGSGGSGTATRRMPGSPGTGAGNGTVNGLPTSIGGSSVLFGGGGAPVTAVTSNGNAGGTNTGGGGSGATNSAVTNNNLAAGGGGAESVYLLITSPAATYTYTVGPGGAGGVSTNSGGAGGAGQIQVIEHYGT